MSTTTGNHHNFSTDTRGNDNSNEHSNRGNGRSNSAFNTVQVFTPHFASVLNIPKDDIFHYPPKFLNVNRLVLCERSSKCRLGARCKFVHANIERATEHEIHVNYAYRSLDHVEYERFPAGKIVEVADPNSSTLSQRIPTDQLLKTAVFDTPEKLISHCAHFYFNRTCNLGSKCRFVHAVYIDVHAKKHQRAPAPLEKRSHHLQRRPKAATSSKRERQTPVCTTCSDGGARNEVGDQRTRFLTGQGYGQCHAGTLMNIQTIQTAESEVVLWKMLDAFGIGDNSQSSVPLHHNNSNPNIITYNPVSILVQPLGCQYATCILPTPPCATILHGEAK